MNNEENAKKLVETIKRLASKEENLDNLECYLSHHFNKWMQKWAFYPDGLVNELERFANME
jgi:hypothetical protein